MPRNRRNWELDHAYQTACRMIQNGDVESLKHQLEHYPNLASWRDCPDGRGTSCTLLHEACGSGPMDWHENAPRIAQELIRAGAPINNLPPNEKGETPLHEAVSVNNIEVAEVLLKAGANPEMTGRFDGTIDTALGYALFYGSKEEIPKFRINCPELLIQYRAIVYLPFAAAMGDLGQVKRFFRPDHQLQPNAGLADRQKVLAQAFLFACQNGQQDICEYLLYRGADVNAQIDFFHFPSTTGLHLACSQGHQKDLVQFLLEKGADPTVQDGLYETNAEGWAMFFGQDEVYRLFK